MNVVEYIIKFREQGFAKNVSKAEQQVDKLDRKLSGTTKTANKFENALKAAAVVAFAASVINITADFEKYDAVLTNTLGSQQKSATAMKMIRDLAATTPFSVNKLTESFVKLSNQGFVPDATQLVKLGDLAASTGKDFDQLAEAVLDARVGEFERLKEFGIKASKMGDQVSFSFKGVTTTVAATEKGIQDYLLSLGDMQGVSGSMAAISKTLGGVLSNLGDQFDSIKLIIGSALRPIMIALTDTLKFLGDLIINNESAFRTLVFVLGTLVGIIGSIIVAMKAWAAIQTVINFLLTANPIGLIIVAVFALIAGIVALYQRSETFRGILNGLWNVFKGVFAFLKAVFMPIFAKLGEVFRDIGSKVQEYLEKPIALAKAAFMDFVDFLEKIPGVGKLVTKLKENFSEGFKKGVEQFRKEQEKTKIGANVNVSGTTDPAGLGTGLPGTTPTKAAPSTVSSAAPKQFNINVTNLVREFNVNSNNTINETAADVKEKIQMALLEALADLEIAR